MQENLNENEIEIFYVDGGFSKTRNKDFPAYGSFKPVRTKIIDGKEEIVGLGEQVWIQHKNSVTTNNQSEFASYIYLLNYLKDNWKRDQVLIRLDSLIVFDGVEKNKGFSDGTLKSLCQQAIAIRESCSFKIYLQWVSGNYIKVILGH